MLLLLVFLPRTSSSQFWMFETIKIRGWFVLTRKSSFQGVYAGAGFRPSTVLLACLPQRGSPSRSAGGLGEQLALGLERSPLGHGVLVPQKAKPGILKRHFANLQGCGIKGFLPTSVIQGKPLSMNKIVFGKPFLLYHRSGHSPQPC